MGDTLSGLIVLAIGGSVAPPLLLLTTLFLGSRRPLLNAAALALAVKMRARPRNGVRSKPKG